MTTNKIEYPKYINAISLDDLLLNTKYPRLSKSKQGKDEVEVIKFMLSKSAIILARTARDLNKIIKE